VIVGPIVGLLRLGALLGCASVGALARLVDLSWPSYS